MKKKNNSKLGVAVIGLGVGEQHARTYKSIKECDLKWLYDLDNFKAEKLSNELEAKTANSLDQILEDPSIDIVSIASYDNAHYDQIVQSLKQHKHVFVEKPMCQSYKELKKIKESWEDNEHLKLQSNLILRSAVIYQWLYQQIDSGQLGKIYSFDGDYLYGRLEKLTHGWRKDVKNYSAIQGGGIHLIDLMIWLTGQKPISVNATGSNICTKNTDFKYEDYVSTTYEFRSGLTGRITANMGCVHKHQHVVRVFGTKGTFIYDDKGPRIYTSRDPETPALNLDMPTLPFSKGELIPIFVRSILNKDNENNCTQQEFDTMSACLAVQESLKYKKKVAIKYI